MAGIFKEWYAYVTHLTWVAPVCDPLLQYQCRSRRAHRVCGTKMHHPVRIRGSEILSWLLQTQPDEDSAARRHACRTEETGRVRLSTVRSGSTLYSRPAAALASAYLCVFADVWSDSRYYWNLLIHVRPWGEAQMSLWIRITPTRTSAGPLWYYLPLFFLSALKP